MYLTPLTEIRESFLHPIIKQAFEESQTTLSVSVFAMSRSF